MGDCSVPFEVRIYIKVRAQEYNEGVSSSPFSSLAVPYSSPEGVGEVGGRM